jgi:hypothetical protein
MLLSAFLKSTEFSSREFVGVDSFHASVSVGPVPTPRTADSSQSSEWTGDCVACVLRNAHILLTCRAASVFVADCHTSIADKTEDVFRKASRVISFKYPHIHHIKLFSNAVQPRVISLGQLMRSLRVAKSFLPRSARFNAEIVQPISMKFRSTSSPH